MKKAIITIIYENEEMFNSIQHILHCLDCEAFQVTTEENGEYTPEQHKEEPKKVIDWCKCEVNTIHRTTLENMIETCRECHKAVTPVSKKIEELILLRTNDWDVDDCIQNRDKINELINHLNNKPKLPPIPTNNMNSFQAVWEYLKKLKEATE